VNDTTWSTSVCGVAEVFLFTEPLGGWRRTAVTKHRARLDWAKQIRQLLEVDYPRAEIVVLVMDNLNTHSTASLYEAFEPEVARGLAQRLEIHHTPKHGSWLISPKSSGRAVATMLEPTDGPNRNRPRRMLGMGPAEKRTTKGRRLAVHHRGRQNQAKAIVPTNSIVKDY